MERHETSADRPWHHKARWWVAIGFLATFAAFLALLDPLASYLTRKALTTNQAIKGDFATVHVSLFRLAYEVTQLKLTERAAPPNTPPLFYAEGVRVELSVRDLLHLRPGVRVILEHPKATFVTTAKPLAIPPVTEIHEQLVNLFPFRLTRLEVLRGELLVIDGTLANRPQLWIHHIEATVENVASRRRYAQGKAARIAARGTVQRSGQLVLFLTADPLAKQPSFAGDARLTGLQLREVSSFLLPETGMTFSKGTFDAFVAFKSRNGQITGSVKPVLRDVQVQAGHKDVRSRMKAGLADAGLDLFSNRIPDRNAVATIIPIKGSLQDPHAQLEPTLLALLRNAFVEGLAESLAGLPIPTAPKQEGLLQQARRALSKHHKTPIRAQPEGKP